MPFAGSVGRGARFAFDRRAERYRCEQQRHPPSVPRTASCTPYPKHLDKELERLSEERLALKESIGAAEKAIRTRSDGRQNAKTTRLALQDLRELLKFATADDRHGILRAIVARDESAVTIDPEHVDVRLSLAAPGSVSTVAQAHAAG